MRPWVEQLVDRLLDNVAAKSRFDLAEDFAAAIPIEVIGTLLRIPEHERGPLRAWSLAILGALEFKLTPQRLAEGNQSVVDFLAFLDDLVNRRRDSLSDDDDDLLARLIRWEADGFKLRGADLYHQIVFLLNAGHETTTNLIGNSIGLLLDNPDQLRLLQQDPTHITTAIEEILRMESPLQIGNRLAGQDIDLGHTILPKGTYIHTSIAGANRDPEQFENPDSFDITRDRVRHFSFGAGMHGCPGAQLARMEMSIALQALVQRLKSVSRAADPVWEAGNVGRTLSELRLLVRK